MRSLQDVGCRGEEGAGGQLTSCTRRQGRGRRPWDTEPPSQDETGCRAAGSDLRPSRAGEPEHQDQKLLAGWVRVRAPHQVKFQINPPPQETTYSGLSS